MNRIAMLSCGTAGLTAAAVAAFLLLRAPPPSSGEDGVFENDCCGSVAVAHGRISLNGSQVARYAVGRDADGPYLLPCTYVGVVEDQGFAVDGTEPARKLRLDRLPGPESIRLPLGTRSFVFRKKGLPARQP